MAKSKYMIAVVYTGFSVGGGVPGAMVPFGRVLFHCRKPKFRVFSNSKIFKKCLKKQWKNYKSLKILRKFCDFLKTVSKFSQKFRENLENFLNIMTFRGFESWIPPKLAKILKNQSKINGKLKIFETFPEILANFDLTKLILSKNQLSFLGSF